jgi:hypothetical protein
MEVNDTNQNDKPNIEPTPIEPVQLENFKPDTQWREGDAIAIKNPATAKDNDNVLIGKVTDLPTQNQKRNERDNNHLHFYNNGKKGEKGYDPKFPEGKRLVKPTFETENKETIEKARTQDQFNKIKSKVTGDNYRFKCTPLNNSDPSNKYERAKIKGEATANLFNEIKIFIENYLDLKR